MKPSKVEITVDACGRGSVIVDGRDLSNNVRSVRLEAGVNDLTVVHLTLIGADVTIAAEALVSAAVAEDKARAAAEDARRAELRQRQAARDALHAQRRVST